MCLSNFKFNEDELKRAFPKYFKNMGFEGRGMQISLPANMDLRLFAETTVPEELVKKAWAKQTWTTAMKDLFFGKFMGEGVNNIIQVLNDLEKEAGDRITQSLVLKLKGDGVTGDDILEGNEEKMEYRSFDFTINQLRNAVRLKGKFEEKKSKENMRKNAKDGLSIWLRERIDDDLFKVLTNNPTADKVIYGGTGILAEANITSTAKMNTTVLGKAKRLAQMSNPKIRPVRVNGGEYYVMVLHPYQIRDLKEDDKWINAQQYANIRGMKNPIFTGATGLYNGVVVHENENVPIGQTGDSSTWVGHGLLLGAQAGVMANGIDLSWKEKLFDYDNQYGVAISRTYGVAKSVFKINGSTPTDFATVNILTSAVPD